MNKSLKVSICLLFVLLFLFPEAWKSPKKHKIQVSFSNHRYDPCDPCKPVRTMPSKFSLPASWHMPGPMSQMFLNLLPLSAKLSGPSPCFNEAPLWPTIQRIAATHLCLNLACSRTSCCYRETEHKKTCWLPLLTYRPGCIQQVWGGPRVSCV